MKKEFETFTEGALFAPVKRVRDCDNNGQCACDWRRRKQADTALTKIFSLLSFDREAKEQQRTIDRVRSGAAGRMITPAIPKDRLISSLLDLAPYMPGFVTVHPIAENNKWRLLGIYKNFTCDSGGVVLAWNKINSTWRRLYNVASGCSKAIRFPLNFSALNGHILDVGLCYNCAWFGDNADFKWNLATNEISKAPNP